MCAPGSPSSLAAPQVTTSLTRNRALLGPYGRNVPRAQVGAPLKRLDRHEMLNTVNTPAYRSTSLIRNRLPLRTTIGSQA